MAKLVRGLSLINLCYWFLPAWPVVQTLHGLDFNLRCKNLTYCLRGRDIKCGPGLGGAYLTGTVKDHHLRWYKDHHWCLHNLPTWHVGQLVGQRMHVERTSSRTGSCIYSSESWNGIGMKRSIKPGYKIVKAHRNVCNVALYEWIHYYYQIITHNCIHVQLFAYTWL